MNKFYNFYNSKITFKNDFYFLKNFEFFDDSILFLFIMLLTIITILLINMLFNFIFILSYYNCKNTINLKYNMWYDFIFFKKIKLFFKKNYFFFKFLLK